MWSDLDDSPWLTVCQLLLLIRTLSALSLTLTHHSCRLLLNSQGISKMFHPLSEKIKAPLYNWLFLRLQLRHCAFTPQHQSLFDCATLAGNILPLNNASNTISNPCCFTGREDIAIKNNRPLSQNGKEGKLRCRPRKSVFFFPGVFPEFTSQLP